MEILHFLCRKRIRLAMKRKIPNDELGRISPQEYQQLPANRITIVLDNVRSLNNIGSIFRTADGFRIEKIILCGISTPPPHRDIHKTALGAEEVVPWEYTEDPLEALSALRKRGYHVAAVEQVEESTPLDKLAVTHATPLALVFGHEIRGVSQPVINASDECIEIPQFGTKHSFNVAVSVGIVLWEVHQRLSARSDTKR